jgi:hypothetical protein
MDRDDDDLEETIADLIYKRKRAPKGSATHRLILRQLEGLLPYEMAQPIMEDYGLFMNHRPVVPRTEPARILPLSRRPRRTSGSRPRVGNSD